MQRKCSKFTTKRAEGVQGNLPRIKCDNRWPAIVRFIPRSLRDRVSDLAHIGHQGIVKTKRLIRSRLWYPGIDAQIERKIRSCKQCQAMNEMRSYEPLRPSEMPKGPWQEVSVDFFGSMLDEQYWFVKHCDYSKWVSVVGLRSVSFEALEPVLIKLFSTMGR